MRIKLKQKKRKNTRDKTVTTTYIWIVTVQFSQTDYYVQGSYLQVLAFSKLKNSHFQNEAKCQTFPVKMRFEYD